MNGIPGNLMEAQVVVPGVAAQVLEGLIRTDPGPFGEDTLGLLDDDAAVETRSVTRRVSMWRNSITSKSSTRVSASSTNVSTSRSSRDGAMRWVVPRLPGVDT